MPPLLRAGLHPKASDKLREVGVSASRITQTIGSAPDSAGLHLADGKVNGVPYCAACDLSVRDKSAAQIRVLLGSLAAHGFAAWCRLPGADHWPATSAPHVHAVYCAVEMKAGLQAQIRDWLAGKNGLRSHAAYKWWQPTEAQRAAVKEAFDRSKIVAPGT